MQKEMKDMLQAKTDTNDKQCIWGSKINEPLTSLHLGLIKQGLKHIHMNNATKAIHITTNLM